MRVLVVDMRTQEFYIKEKVGPEYTTKMKFEYPKGSEKWFKDFGRQIIEAEASFFYSMNDSKN